MEKNKKLNITYVDPSTLSPAHYNPRKWDKIAIDKLTEGIRRFGIVDPLIVNSATNRKNVLIGGHMRLASINQLGIEKVPVIYLNIPDIEKEKELNLRLNRNTGQWDWDLLKSFDVDFLNDIGFDDSDLESIWDDALSTEDDRFDTEEELKKLKNPRTRPGDIYKLGPHTLGCRDATNKPFIDKLVGSSKIDMIYFDPPFNISLDYDKGISGKGSYGGGYKDNKSRKEYGKLLEDSISNALSHAKNDCHVFCYCDESYIGLLQDIYIKLGITNKRVCLWIKESAYPTPLLAFSKIFEACIYGTLGKPYLSNTIHNLSEILNKEIGSVNGVIDDILDMINIWLVKRHPTKEYEHPTQKPITLHEKPIRRCTRPGDTILDTFGGSGSTLVACQQLKRRCIISELEPIFCDLILTRFLKLTGIKPELINTLEKGR